MDENELKLLLFSNTNYYCHEYQRYLKLYGQWDSSVDLKRAKFTVLYEIIEDSGLEEEYAEWKESLRGNEENK